MMGNHQSAKADGRGQRGEDHSFTGAEREMAGQHPAFSPPVEDDDPIFHSRSHNEGHKNAVGKIELDSHPFHYSQGPKGPQRQWRQGQQSQVSCESCT